MPIKITWENGGYKLEWEFAPAALAPGYDREVIGCQQIVASLAATLESGLKKLDLKRLGVAPLTYKYSFTTNDNRTWTQTMIFSAVTDPSPTNVIDVPAPGFRDSEFLPHHTNLRRKLIEMINRYDITKLEVTK